MWYYSIMPTSRVTTRVTSILPGVDEWVVYALTAGDGATLYVGSSTNLPGRLRRHSDTKPWWPEVAAVTWLPIERDRWGRFETERHVISSLAPPHNQHGNYGLYCAEQGAVFRREAIDRARRFPQIRMHQHNAELARWVEALWMRRRPAKRYGWVEL